MKKDDQFTRTLNKLIEIALDDGIINSDELNIIRQVELDTQKYLDLLKNALEDGIITEEEGKELRNFRSEILDRAEEIATADGKISEDEQILLRRLLNIIATEFKKY